MFYTHGRNLRGCFKDEEWLPGNSCLYFYVYTCSNNWVKQNTQERWVIYLCFFEIISMSISMEWVSLFSYEANLPTYAVEKNFPNSKLTIIIIIVSSYQLPKLLNLISSHGQIFSNFSYHASKCRLIESLTVN